MKLVLGRNTTLFSLAANLLHSSISVRTSPLLVQSFAFAANTAFTRLFRYSRTTVKMTASSSVPTPPIIRRDEDRFVWIGKVADDDEDPYKNNNVLRQAEDSKEPLLDPPVALLDPYGWMRMRDDSRTKEEVLNHLHAENAFTEQITSSSAFLQEEIYQDFLRMLQETDYTTPAVKGNFIYYKRTFQGKSYSVHCRAPVLTTTPDDGEDFYALAQQWDKSADTPILPGEHILLDENQLAEGKSHCDVGTIQISPSGNLMAYTLDEIGGEKYKLFVQNLETKEQLQIDVVDIDSSISWGADDTSLYYLRFDDTHRPFQVYKHILNLKEEDQLLYQEDDELFWVGLHKSQDEKFLFIDSSSKGKRLKEL